MSVTPQHPRIVIVGAGIVGLNTALVLSRRGLGQSIVVVAEHLPGDTSINYASPWAGANFSAISGSDPNALRWDRLGYSHLMQLAQTRGRESFVQRTPSVEYWDEGFPADKINSISEYMQDFSVLPQEELPDGAAFGAAFTTVTLNAPKHLEWLFSYLRTEFGVRFVRKKLAHVNDAFSEGASSLVFNYTGNSPWSNGSAILGGYMQKGVSTSDTFSHETESILRRTDELSPEIHRGPSPDIVGVVAGLRPSREGGARVEKVEVEVGGQARVLVHKYGAGGTGYRAGYGMALDAVASVDDVLKQCVEQPSKARL
ncbi:d-amino acid oxidase [Colletotrichum plurivorum]|uniref:D-amino acid oxidase n=1 Tax=Colletotrichum plurivorum TaxID=2175906 RepID=A0A8H6KX23_9PEZI|nr:d-amino acid oxidase [Colletotrichum plurivorum]